MNEIMTKLEDQHKAIVEFKAKYDGEINRLEKEIDEIVRKGRPGLTCGESARLAADHKSAWEKWARKGTEDMLEEIEKKAMSVGTPADGGYAVPAEISANIEALALAHSPLRKLCRIERTTTSDFSLLVNKRGLAISRVGEKDLRPETATPVLEEIKPPIGELYANPAATQKALDDIFFDVGNWLVSEIYEAFAVGENADFTNGNGTNCAKGFLTYPTAATADATRAFGTIQHIATGTSGAFKTQSSTVSPADDLIDMIYAMKAGYRSGAVWMMNSKTLSVIRKWKDQEGNYIWQSALTAGQPGQILGYPVYENESMPDVGAGALPIVFANFRNAYCIVDRVGVRVLRDPYSNKPYVHFYTTKRVGGCLVNSEAIKVLKLAAS